MTRDRGHFQHAEAFLARRDGIDKTLKLLRYAAKVWLAVASDGDRANSDLIQRLQHFEGSISTSRKALRLGKFLQSVNALNEISKFDSDKQHLRYLHLLANGGEGFYYFLEQLVWLTKAGIVSSRHSRQLRVVAAWAELAGYAGSIPLKLVEIGTLREALKCSSEDPTSKVRQKLYLKAMSVIQDVLDGLLALSDITDGPRGLLARPLPLALAGLLSGAISAQKNWLTC